MKMVVQMEASIEMLLVVASVMEVVEDEKMEDGGCVYGGTGGGSATGGYGGGDGVWRR